MKKKVLCVDDEAPMLTILERLLRNHGYDPLVAESGEEALGIIEIEHPQVCLLDLRMSPMDGFDVIERIQELDPSMLVYALSAHLDPTEPRRYKDAGFAGTIGKPFEIPQILNTLKAAFELLEGGQ